MTTKGDALFSSPVMKARNRSHQVRSSWSSSDRVVDFRLRIRSMACQPNLGPGSYDLPRPERKPCAAKLVRIIFGLIIHLDLASFASKLAKKL